MADPASTGAIDDPFGIAALACGAIVVVAAATSAALTALLVRAGRRLGALDSAGAAGHAKVLRDVPNVGGVAIAATLVVPVALGLLLLHLLPDETWLGLVPALGEPAAAGSGDMPGPTLLDRARASTPDAVALLLGVLVLHVTGLVDDRRSLGPWPKLLVQAAAAIGIVWFTDARLLTLLGPAASAVLTVLWIVLVVNAFNFIDNMDGLAGGTGAIAAALFMAACLLGGQWFVALVLALLAGALAGFLVFNVPPARIFMGDGGSLVVGFVLAVLVARITFVHGSLGGNWYGIFMPLAVLAVPLYDFCTVTAIRLSQGRSPFVGDQQHFSHRLVRRGLSRRGAVIVIWGVSLVTGISGIVLGALEPWQAVLVGAQVVVLLGLIGVLEHAARPKGEPADADAASAPADDA